jgi:peptidoglycan hydrolase-like protein with peptidoglycan-binding domain
VSHKVARRAAGGAPEPTRSADPTASSSSRSASRGTGPHAALGPRGADVPASAAGTLGALTDAANASDRAMLDEARARVSRATGEALPDVPLVRAGPLPGGALAVMQDGQVHVGDGFEHQTADRKRRILAHEVAHVAQREKGASEGHTGGDAEGDAETVARAALSGGHAEASVGLTHGAHPYTERTTSSATGTFATIVATKGWLQQGVKLPSEVKKLQSTLAAQGLYTKGVDGDFGSFTHAAVEAFQRKNGLFVDGKVGPKTAAVLDKAGGAPATSAPTTSPAPAAPTSVASMVTKYGSIAYKCRYPDAVKAVQTRLRDLGYYRDTIDGDFGPITLAAVKAFQTAQRLEVDGVVGPITAGRLDAARATTPTPAPAAPSSGDAAGVLARLGQLEANAGNRSRYDAIYANPGGQAVKDYHNAHAGENGNRQKSGAYANPDLLGFDVLSGFVASGAWDGLDEAQKSAFGRGMEQIGSFYGGAPWQGGIDSGYTFNPSGATGADLYDNGYVKQRDGLVGKWECSSLSSYIAGTRREDTRQMMGHAVAPDWDAARADPSKIPTMFPVGTILVRGSSDAQGDWSGHSKSVMGWSGGQLITMEAEGSGTFVHAQLQTLDELERAGFKVIRP